MDSIMPKALASDCRPDCRGFCRGLCRTRATRPTNAPFGQFRRGWWVDVAEQLMELVVLLENAMMGSWLVVWNIWIVFPYWECHHPNSFSYFSEGLKPPARKALRSIVWDTKEEWKPPVVPIAPIVEGSQVVSSLHFMVHVERGSAKSCGFKSPVAGWPCSSM